ncbi:MULTISPECIES: MFS transporter [unclassified Phenylobacterium]|uniref:spinster family MFS transporter n=1 Tax=unclassified Phenylobacterium TaxID=2640670 RepID=UPI00083A5BDE|nr:MULTISPECIES: MFS transporter [unclassified Phenylobacterium]
MTAGNSPRAAPTFSRAYLRYALALLFLVNLVNMVDRAALSVLLEQIRREMSLSDTQVGILSGFAFSLFYAGAGIFLSRLSDLYNRPVVMTAAIVIWSGMSALTGAAHGFLQFFLARMGVGVSESSAIPTCSAMIGDYFPPSRRALALGVFSIGSFLGVVIGFSIGGYIGFHFGWRWAFVAAGLLGLPVALLTWTTLRDPPRGWSDGAAPAGQGAPPSLARTLRTLGGDTAFLTLILSAGLITFLAYGVTGWLPAFLIRVHHLDQVSVGFQFGAALSIGSAIGSIGGGVLANRLSRRSLVWLTRTPLLLSLLFLPAFELAIYAPDPQVALTFIALSSAVGAATLGPVLAAIQTVAPATMRATAAGLTGFSGSLIGLGGAPLLVGLLSDHFAQSTGAGEALRTALGIAGLVALLMSAMLLAANLAFSRSLTRQPPLAQSGEPEPVTI